MQLLCLLLAMASILPSTTAQPIDERASCPNAKSPWIPAIGESWQIVLNAPLKIDPKTPSVTPDVNVYTIDLFDNSAQTVAALHKLNKKVVAYFSAGTYEEWRSDANKFKKDDLGKPMEDWEGERWLNLKSKNVRDIMAQRIKLAKEKGFDAIDPDNVDGYNNKNGLGLKKADSVDFIKYLSHQARAQGLGIGLKNAGEIIPDVLPLVDFQVNEECVKYNECQTFEAFIKAGKAVFHIEYPKGAPGKVSKKDKDKVFGAKGAARFTTLLKTMDLDGWVEYRDGKQYKTKTK
ncbi:glycoside-hydrolase family [Sarocladium implicatum]|nr:glycoside-hydrolase family [Sarocladium implicatum]